MQGCSLGVPCQLSRPFLSERSLLLAVYSMHTTLGRTRCTLVSLYTTLSVSSSRAV